MATERQWHTNRLGFPAITLLTLVLFVRPGLFIDEWVWPLTPLTARPLSAFVGFPAVVCLTFALDRRPSSFRIPIEVVTFGLALIGVASMPAAGELRGSGGLVWGFAALARWLHH